MSSIVGEYQNFEVSLEDPGIAIICFNTPRRLNGFTVGMKRDLVEVLLQMQMDDGVRVIIITGSTDPDDPTKYNAFCAGDDTMGKPGYQAQPEGKAMKRINPGHDSGIQTYNALRHISQAVNQTIRKIDKLTIAAMQGFAIQTGFSMALACDYRIADTTAKMGSATLRFGLLPDEGGQYLLVQHLGLQRALDFFMRRRIVTAAEADELGLLHKVVEPEQLMPEALTLARELAEGPQVAMRLLKKTLYNAAELTFAQACDDIATVTAITDHHPDTRGAIQAFQEKRPPKFNAWLEGKARL